MLGDAADALPRLTDALAGHSGDGAARVAALREEFGYFEEPPAGEVAGRVSPRRLARILGEAIPSDAIITCDAGENRIFMLHDFRTSGQIVLAPNGAGGMGYGIPAATAATYAYPGRPAVAVVGDGGFGMSIHGLMSAVDNGRRLVVVVMDNGALGWVAHGQGEREFLARFTEFNFEQLVDSVNCQGFTAHTEDEVRTAVKAALDHSGVSVVVVKTDLVDDYRSITTRFATGRAGAAPKDSHEL